MNDNFCGVKKSRCALCLLTKLVFLAARSPPQMTVLLLASETVLTSCILFTVLFSKNPTLLTGMRCYLQETHHTERTRPLKLDYRDHILLFLLLTTNFIGEHDTIGHYATN